MLASGATPATAKAETSEVTIRLPKDLAFLMEMHPYKILYGGRGGGKCLALGTKVIMADGSLRAVEDVRAGESLMGPDSRPRRVFDTVRGKSQLYRVKQSSGIEYVVNEGHILSLKKSASAQNDLRMWHTGKPRSPNGRYPSWPAVTNMPVELYAAQSKRWRAHFRGYRAGCLKFSATPVLIDPYLLGMWLGDGTSASLAFTTADEEIIDYFRDFAQDCGGDISIYQDRRSAAKTICLLVKSGRTNPIWTGFKAYGLPKNKHIPAAYLFNCEETRLQLLAGLVDSDGHMHHNGYAIAQTREVLARQIKQLADGLGFRTTIIQKKTSCSNTGAIGTAWTVRINGDTWRIPCIVRRKQIRREDVRKNKDFLLSELTVTPCGVGEWAGFSLDGDHLFLLEDGTVTHNTENIGRALIALAANQKLRILCAREIQNSIAESVHATLKSLIEEIGLSAMFRITDKKISCPVTGSEFIFHGLHGHTVESLKSLAKLDIVWVEEAHVVAKHSWDVLIPTMREENAEIWVSFNPGMDTDDTWTRFVVHPPDGAVVLKINWSDNKWFPAILEKARQHCLKHYPDDYENIWEGKCRTVVTGAIYAKEVLAMIEERRFGGVGYDPRYPVHRVWDLGWNDAMSIIMVQKPTPTFVNIVNYMEGSFLTYAQWIAIMRTLGYVWGDDWLPHDAAQHDPKSGTNAKKLLATFGCKVKIIDRSTDEARIKAARMMAPRVYVDNAVRKAPPEHPDIFHGCTRLMDCLKRYRRAIPISTGEPARPVHDEYSHGADAWGGLAEIVDQIRNDCDLPPVERLPSFSPAVAGTGMLG